MSNGFQDNGGGGISFSAPIYSFGNTTPAVNSGTSFDLPMATIQAMQNRALEFSVQNSNANRGFLQNVIGNSQDSLTSYNNEVMARLGQINDSMAETLRYGIKKRSQGGFGCFITTAVCESSGLPDDCEELQTLRNFRDGFMMENTTRENLVKLYYDVAPLIVDAINARENRAEILDTLRTAYILPAVEAIKAGNNEAAFWIYSEMLRVAATFARGE